jgi:hypothetical protein
MLATAASCMPQLAALDFATHYISDAECAAIARMTGGQGKTWAAGQILTVQEAQDPSMHLEAHGASTLVRLARCSQPHTDKFVVFVPAGVAVRPAGVAVRPLSRGQFIFADPFILPAASQCPSMSLAGLTRLALGSTHGCMLGGLSRMSGLRNLAHLRLMSNSLNCHAGGLAAAGTELVFWRPPAVAQQQQQQQQQQQFAYLTGCSSNNGYLARRAR